MKHPPPLGSKALPKRPACCAEAQADGVPCTSLGRDCEDCQRAATAAAEIKRERSQEDVSDDSWAV